MTKTAYCGKESDRKYFTEGDLGFHNYVSRGWSSKLPLEFLTYFL